MTWIEPGPDRYQDQEPRPQVEFLIGAHYARAAEEDDEPAPPRRSVGFASSPPVVEPLLWDGDQA